MEAASTWPAAQSASAERLRQELAEAEAALESKQQQEQQQQEQESASTENFGNDPLPQDSSSSVTKLAHLDQTADELLFSKDLALWIAEKDTTKIIDHDKKEDEPTLTNSDGDDMAAEVQSCLRLGQMLLRHKNSNSSSRLYNSIYKGEYLPTVEYVKCMLLFELRKCLRQVNYPSAEACTRLLQEMEEQENRKNGSEFHKIVFCASSFHQLQVANDEVVARVQGTSPAPPEVDSVVLELCRPFVERIRHHFVVQAETDQDERIDRLPEWLLSYVKENVFHQDGPWDLIHYGLNPAVRSDLSVDFANEIIRLIQWVFAQRGFFRHPRIAGPRSEPILLCNAIEHLLQFDDFIMNEVFTGRLSGRVLSLMDIYVAGDDEVLHWWMDREREAVFDSLFYGKVVENSDNYLGLLVSPRAEIFCSLLRSMKRKATVFSFSGPYLNHCCAPLCMQFLDAVHDSATDLKDDLFNQRKLPTSSDLQASVRKWIELINGTHMSAQLLAGAGDEALNVGDKNEDEVIGGARSTANQDMLRFGQSLERLEQVFVEEFASSFVDNIMLEKAKLASYLMRCSHLLAINDMEDSDLSPDLADAQHMLDAFLDSVDEQQLLGGAMMSSQASEEAALYAPRALRDRVLTLVSEKFLEVALDWHGTTPDIFHEGAQAFASDLALLFGDSLLPPSAMRLLDVAKCLSMDSAQLGVIGDALCGLAGQSPPLTEEVFAVDDRVFEEAMSMVRAKDLVWLQLGDFLSILNRRRDLSHMTAF